jgi:hypothetical protein
VSSCSCKSPAGGDKHAPLAGVSIATRRYREIAGWLVPSAIIAVLPKCPACVAMYIALGTGLGVSMSAASKVRFGLLALCVGSISYFASRHLPNSIVSKFPALSLVKSRGASPVGLDRSSAGG